MIQDPAILANILIVLSVALAMVPVYLVARKIWLTWTRSLDEPEPETYGDDGGHPTAEVCRRAAQKVTRERVRQMTPAPEIGSGLLAGDKSHKKRTE